MSFTRLPRSLFAGLAFTALVVGGVAHALRPAAGMEFMLTDLGARGLVGYGQLVGDTFTLRLSGRESSLRVVVAFATGGLDTYIGEIAGDRLWLYRADLGWFDLATVLASEGVSLRLVFDDGRQLTVAALPPSATPDVGPGVPWPAASSPPPTSPEPTSAEPPPADDDDALPVPPPTPVDDDVPTAVGPPPDDDEPDAALPPDGDKDDGDEQDVPDDDAPSAPPDDGDAEDDAADADFDTSDVR